MFAGNCLEEGSFLTILERANNRPLIGSSDRCYERKKMSEYVPISLP
jgi:hypothetical protein